MEPPIPAPTLRSPIGGQTVEEQTIAFTWDPIPQADAYEVQIAHDEAFERLLFNNEVGEARYELEETLLSDLEDTMLHWRVRARRGEAWGARSEPARFTPSAAPASPVPAASPNVPFDAERQSRLGWIVLVTVIVVSMGVIGVLVVTLAADGLRDDGEEGAVADSLYYETVTEAEQRLGEYAAQDDGSYRTPLDRAIEMMIRDPSSPPLPVEEGAEAAGEEDLEVDGE